MTVVGHDDVAGLALTSEIDLDPATGTLRARAKLTDTAGEPYQLGGLALTVPLPARARELLTYSGRWCREFHPRRQPWGDGAASVITENRSGRTSHDSVPIVWAGTHGFGEWSGEAWGLHLAWSGNTTVLAESLSDGRRALQLGELLRPGELTIEPGGSYTTPWLFGVHSDERPDRREPEVAPLDPGTAQSSPLAATGRPQLVGGGLLRPRSRPAVPARRTGRRGRHRALRARRRLVLQPS